MLLVAILETTTFRGLGVPPLRVNPARGVDLPDLDLGVKSPSENYCTSEPFFSAYQRLLGSEHDMVVLLTDYQTAKKKPPLRLQIIAWRYLTANQVADENLCRIADQSGMACSRQRGSGQKGIPLSRLRQPERLAWQATAAAYRGSKERRWNSRVLADAMPDFEKKNHKFARSGMPLIPEDSLESLREILAIAPLHIGVIDAADDWVIQTQKEAGRAPSDNEWHRLLAGPLDGLIGMSFALQWRYNFARLFNTNAVERDDDTNG